MQSQSRRSYGERRDRASYSPERFKYRSGGSNRDYVGGGGGGGGYSSHRQDTDTAGRRYRSPQSRAYQDDYYRRDNREHDDRSRSNNGKRRYSWYDRIDTRLTRDRGGSRSRSRSPPPRRRSMSERLGERPDYRPKVDMPKSSGFSRGRSQRRGRSNSNSTKRNSTGLTCSEDNQQQIFFFICNDKTLREVFDAKVFAGPSNWDESCSKHNIDVGTPMILRNVGTGALYGPFLAASDVKHHDRRAFKGRFPFQVRLRQEDIEAYQTKPFANLKVKSRQHAALFTCWVPHSTVAKELSKEALAHLEKTLDWNNPREKEIQTIECKPSVTERGGDENVKNVKLESGKNEVTSDSANQGAVQINSGTDAINNLSVVGTPKTQEQSNEPSDIIELDFDNDDGMDDEFDITDIVGD